MEYLVSACMCWVCLSIKELDSTEDRLNYGNIGSWVSKNLCCKIGT